MTPACGEQALDGPSVDVVFASRSGICKVNTGKMDGAMGGHCLFVSHVQKCGITQIIIRSTIP